jgi:hypothetical protein
MNYLNDRLPPLDRVDSDMWIDEAIWGHMLYDEQTPWLIYLEFLNILLDHNQKGIAFTEPAGLNRLKYKASWRLELRNILFNSPRLQEIRRKTISDHTRWSEWYRSMAAAGGIEQPDFAYLNRRFNGFDDFADLVELIRGTGIEAGTNKRWTSKYVFPYGPDCIYEDLDQNARTNDRHFFRRSGELLYLMLCRSNKKDDVLKLLLPVVDQEQSAWNTVVRYLQPENAGEKGAERANAFLPYPFHETYDALGGDWASILQLGMPGFDALPYLVDVAGFHLIQYQLRVARDVAKVPGPLKIVCEIVAPKKTLIREISSETYQENNLLSGQAVMAYLDQIEKSDEWQLAKCEAGAFAKCKSILRDRVLWGDDYPGASNPDDLIADLRASAKRRHEQHGGRVHRSYGREIGLVSKRGALKLRYAPNDEFLKGLIFANVPARLELHQFLRLLWERYGLVFGDREAEVVLPKDEFDKKAFQANGRRLEYRLSSLGLLKRLSDGCAYVVNPYYRRNV